MKVSKVEFEKLYIENVKSVFEFWSDKMQKEIAAHNIGWDYPTDFKNYLELSLQRYYLAYLDIPETATSICDVGGFWGVFPLTLKDLGYNVTMTEAKKYYSSSFDSLFNYIEKKGITIVDIDPFENNISKNITYDFVCVMAVLEHYPHSLCFFLNNVNSIISNEGILYIEVPNIAYLLKRLKFILGISPLVHIKDINNSKTPFTGHHHEYTMGELRYLFQSMNYKITNEHYYNYSYDYTDFLFILKRLPYYLALKFFPNAREVISIAGRKN